MYYIARRYKHETINHHAFVQMETVESVCYVIIAFMHNYLGTYLFLYFTVLSININNILNEPKTSKTDRTKNVLLCYYCY